MDTIRLLQTLEGFPQQDIIQYHVIHSFLKKPTFSHLVTLIGIFDQEINGTVALNAAQSACMKYLFRDWAYQHLRDTIKLKQRQLLFKDAGSAQAPGHFMTAIDFAKRNPKDNQVLMRFCLMLLIHHPKPTSETHAKINAIEQLLTQQELQAIAYTPTTFHEKKLYYLMIYTGLLAFYCLWLLITLEYPKL